MKKILLCSFVISGILFANQLSYITLNKSNLSNKNGGNKSAIDAYSDGIGIYTAGKFEIDNKAMNELVFSHGETAKKEGKTLKEYVLENGSDKEKSLAEKLGNIAENIIPADGTSCDDKNPNTDNDIYLNGICKGISIKTDFQILFENGTSILGGEINFDTNQLKAYRINGNIHPKGYVSSNMQYLKDQGVKELIIKVDSQACGYGYFGKNTSNYLLNNYNYGIAYVFYNINLETFIASVTSSYYISAKTINFSSFNLSELIIGSASAQAHECWQDWDVKLIY